ncbi:MAG: NADH-quinone oxidoreductase subunit N [Candidatus Liberibacter europaeus]|uniref:NADH-quinone oxidoreductase subunit N n=1 Tax=Candidatus Liberibacter europaeus TaxID=744859 RepID=A0A2T4VX71_9HYPH|nr:NADH-quinone oxidoreductase subunit N [Candidatus Liberibacter europaeus]PTL86379.1 MAG: NADH-quinone oxidoreductase subunit N [Candidatus Liberibacter europaeus]
MIPMNVMIDLYICIPEIVVAIGSLLLLLMGVFSRGKNLFLLIFFPIIILSIAFFALIMMNCEGIGFSGTCISDKLSFFVKSIILASSIVIFIMMLNCVHLKPFSRFEFPVVILIAILGMLLVISSNDMISFYMALELLSLSLYIAIAMNRDSMISIESAMKYFILGAFSSCFLLYGMSFIYGFTGHTDFLHIATSLFVGNNSFVIIIGIVFILIGLFFKIALVPFHMWIPDVYEGSPMLVTAFLATVPKFTVAMALLRITSVFWPVISGLTHIFMIVSVLSMVLGSIAAIGQKKIKRLMAYSSIGNAGYALVGFSTGTLVGISATVRYMVIYLIMLLGFFACILPLRNKAGKGVSNIADLSGLSQYDPFLACIITILTFSMAGIPPFAGFFGKYFLFSAAMRNEYYYLVIIGLLSSVISAYYYLRIISVMWFNKPTEGFMVVRREIKPIALMIGLFVICYLLFENFIGFWIDKIVLSLF